MLRNYLAIIYPSYVFLLAKSNEKDTECDIRDMGLRLATEVVAKLEEVAGGPGAPKLSRLSFIGHSLGSVIIRTALTPQPCGRPRPLRRCRR